MEGLQENTQHGIPEPLKLNSDFSGKNTLDTLGKQLKDEIEKNLFVWKDFEFVIPQSAFSNDPAKPIVDLDTLFRVQKINKKF